jgi:hypothetical protein
MITKRFENFGGKEKLKVQWTERTRSFTGVLAGGLNVKHLDNIGKILGRDFRGLFE